MRWSHCLLGVTGDQGGSGGREGGGLTTGNVVCVGA